MLSYCKPAGLFGVGVMKYLVIITLLFAVAIAAAQGREERGEITVDNRSRSFVVYIPNAVSATEKPAVLISLHGRFGTGEQMMKFADFRPIADREKFIIVCPDGINKSWNAGLNTPAHRKDINDVKFIGQLISYAISTYHGDAKRVYITGMSNGGFLASRLACELPNRIAAIAAVGASMDKDQDYHPTKPVPVMYIQGTKKIRWYLLTVLRKNENRCKAAYLQPCTGDILKLWIEADACGEKSGNNYITLATSKMVPASLKKNITNAATGVKVGRLYNNKSAGTPGPAVRNTCQKW